MRLVIPLGAAAAALALVVLAGACGSTDTQPSSPNGAGGFITGASSGVGASTSTASSGGAVASSSTSSSSGVGGENSGTGGFGGSPPPCVDIGQGEPNETETNAFPLTDKDDCDNASPISGVIAGGEEDWFRYAGDDAFCIVNPERTFTHMGGLELCKYFECSNGLAATDITCPSGTTPDVTNTGRPGCCKSSGFVVTDVNCTGTIDDDTTVFLRVRAPNANSTTCIDYSISYNY